MSDKLWYLKRCILFEQLTDGQIHRVESRSRARNFPAGRPIYLPTETADTVFLLAKGLAKVSHLTSDGKESTLTFIEPGELFGELALFDGEQRDEFVAAVEPTTVIMIPTEEIQQLMAETAGVALAITKVIGLRRQQIERRLKNLLFLSNRDRLVHLLLDLAEQFGVPTDDGIQLRVRLSHQDLANLIGSTRETVTVILGQLKIDGTVGGGRRKVVLTDPNRLAKSVDRRSPGEPPNLMRFAPAFG